jgi:hypothetical protein
VAIKNHLKHGLDCYRRCAWGQAYDALLRADQVGPLGVDDLDCLATTAYLTARELEFQRLLERLYHAHVASGDRARAARCTFWLSLTFLLRGESGRSHAWAARGQRLIEDRDCVERGYLAVAVAEQQLREGQAEAARASAGEAAAIGEAFRDADLTAAARHAQGRALIQQGDVVGGLKCLDETMLAVVAGELLPPGLRPGSRPRVDGRVFPLLRAAAGHGGVLRHLPRASIRDPAAAGSVGGGAGRDPARVRTGPEHRPQAAGRRAVSAGRDSPAVRGVRESR